VLHHCGQDEVEAGKAEAGSIPAVRLATKAITNIRIIWVFRLVHELGASSDKTPVSLRKLQCILGDPLWR
jgi:hypothetical protein